MLAILNFNFLLDYRYNPFIIYNFNYFHLFFRHSSRRPAKHNKPPKLIPPSKPVISRLNDESVVVRWNVSQDTGLPISFFKVQYRELGPANPMPHNASRSNRWKTANFDIPPNIRNYDITNLKSDHIYR